MITWHALVAIALSLLCLFACAIGIQALAMACFTLALYHAGALLWSFRPAPALAWRVEVRRGNRMYFIGSMAV